MNSLLSEVRAMLRSPLRSPSFSLTVAAVLALGVGANTAIFSVIYGVLLHPFPYAHSERIVTAGAFHADDPGVMPITYPEFNDFRQRARGFEQLAYASNRGFALTRVAEPMNVAGALVSASAWPLLGVRPLAGRVFTEAEDGPGAAPVCVISASLWLERFAGDPAILGRTLMLDRRSYAVVGVMPPRFKFWGADVWVPAGLFADTDFMRSRVIRMNAWMVGRLAPGVALAEGAADLNEVARRIAEEHPDTNQGVGVRLTLLSDSVTGPVRLPLLVLLGAVGFVLLIACANVANLILARNASRQREFAIRTALGSSRGRLARQVVFETVPLALLGCAAGFLAGAWVLRSLMALLPAGSIPAEAEVAVNVPVMLVCLCACVGSMLLFALLPAWELFRTDLNRALQEGGRGSGGPRAARVRATLIAAEFALSLVLLTGAGLLVRSFARLQSVNPGFRADHLLVFTVQLPEARYPSAAQTTRFFRDVLERMGRLPGVTAAAASNNTPLLGGLNIPLLVPGRTYTQLNELRNVQTSAVTEDYFQAQGLRLRAGRAFTQADRPGAEPVVILNEAAVKAFLPAAGDPLGQRVMLGLPPNLIKPGLLPPGLDRFAWLRVVGIVDSCRYEGLQTEPSPAAYIPIGQNFDSPPLRNTMFVLVRTSGDPLVAAAQARSAVAAVDPDQPIAQMTTMERAIADSLRQSRFVAVLLGLFAAVASALAAIGIYGVVAWNVAQRSREIGIRCALGATQREVLRLVVFQSMRVVLIGLAVGLAGSLALSQFLSSLLYQTSASDPWTFAAVAAGLGAVGLAAAFLPARRACRVSPLEAFRVE